jgi:hypothetical protein
MKEPPHEKLRARNDNFDAIGHKMAELNSLPAITQLRDEFINYRATRIYDQAVSHTEAYHLDNPKEKKDELFWGYFRQEVGDKFYFFKTDAVVFRSKILVDIAKPLKDHKNDFEKPIPGREEFIGALVESINHAQHGFCCLRDYVMALATDEGISSNIMVKSGVYRFLECIEELWSGKPHNSVSRFALETDPAEAAKVDCAFISGQYVKLRVSDLADAKNILQKTMAEMSSETNDLTSTQTYRVLYEIYMAAESIGAFAVIEQNAKQVSTSISL